MRYLAGLFDELGPGIESQNHRVPTLRASDRQYGYDHQHENDQKQQETDQFPQSFSVRIEVN